MSAPIHSLSYYDRSKVPWEEEEIENVKKMYITDSLNIIEIANVYKRTPGCIAYKLKSLGIIAHNTLAKGYKEYRNGDLYAEIIKESVNKEAIRKQAKEEKAKNSIHIDEGQETPEDSNIDKPWEDDEVSRLLASIQKKKSIEDIADEHGRTVSSINSRRRHIAADYYFNDKRPIDEIVKFTGLMTLDVHEEIYRRKNADKVKDSDVKVKRKKTKTAGNMSEDNSLVDMEIETMKEDIKELKRDMKEILHLLKSIYEFETQ